MQKFRYVAILPSPRNCNRKLRASCKAGKMANTYTQIYMHVVLRGFRAHMRDFLDAS